MAFRERSAWIMSGILILVGGYYLKLVIGDGMAPIAAFVPFVLFTIALSIVAQIGLAIASPREAVSPLDERERLVVVKAAHFASYALATGVVVALGQFLMSQDGMKLFHAVLTALILGQLAEYGAQIFLLRFRV